MIAATRPLEIASADVRKLLEVLHRLADLGNTVIIIEHNLDVIRNADWVLDLGPEGGEDGGQVVAEGPPALVAQTAGSHTAEFLRRYFPTDPASPANGNASAAAGDPETPKPSRPSNGSKANGKLKSSKSSVTVQ